MNSLPTYPRLLFALSLSTLSSGLSADDRQPPVAVAEVGPAGSLEGHEADVYDVALSRDGSLLASASFDRTARLWALPDGGLVATLEGHEAKVLCVDFRPAGGDVVSAGEDGTVRIWNVPDAASPRLRSGAAAVVSMARDALRRWIATIDANGQVELVAARSGEAVVVLDTGLEASALALSPSARLFAAGGRSGAVRVWDVSAFTASEAAAAGAKEVEKPPTKNETNAVGEAEAAAVRPPPAASDRSGARGSISALAWSPDGAFLAASDERGIVIWGADGNLARRLERPLPASSLAFVDATRLAAADGSPAVTIIDADGESDPATLEGRDGAVRALAALPEARRLLAGAADGSVRVWDVAAGRSVSKIAAHRGAVVAVDWVGSGGAFATVGADGALRVWSADDGLRLAEFAVPRGAREVAGVTESSYAVTVDGDAVVHLRGPVSRTAARVLRGHEGAVHAARYSPDGETIASAGADKTVRLWSAADGSELHELEGHDGSVYAVAFDPAGEVLASGGYDRVIELWRPGDGTELRKLEGHDEGVFCLAFSPDGRFLYSGSSDRTIRKWSVEEGAAVAIFEGHPGWVCGLAVVASGRALVSADYGGHLMTRASSDGRVLSHRKLRTVLYDIAVSSDERWIATANLPSTVSIVDATIEREAARSAEESGAAAPRGF